MKTMMLLLVPAVLVLLSSSDGRPSHHQPAHNLNKILELAKIYNDSITKEIFVEDVSRLTEGSDKCGNKFFCKVYDILRSHNKTSAHHHDKAELERNFRMYINSMSVTCVEVLQDVTPSEETRPIPDLMYFLAQCIKYKNLNPV